VTAKFFISLFIFDISLFLYFSITQHFPFIILFLHLGSVVALGYYLIENKMSFQFLRTYSKDLILCFCLLVLAFCIYSYNINVIPPGLSDDEYSITLDTVHLSMLKEYLPWMTWFTGYPTPLFYFAALSIHFFGFTIWAIRFPDILFGALCVAAFYILLRLFFKKPIAFAGSLLMLFSYQMLIEARMAYEIPPTLLFQILTLISLHFAYKTKSNRSFAAIGFFVGAGLNTYLAFRPFPFLVLIIVIYLLFFKVTKQNLNKAIYKLFVSLISMFTLTVPLFAYGITHVQQLLKHTMEVSVFNMHLPISQLISLVTWNISQLIYIFLPPGDPYFGYNPYGTSLYDIGTTLLFLFGFVLLAKNNRRLFIIFLLFVISPLANDIFSTYDNPLASHNSALIGHPNSLHLSGLITLIYFVCAFGLSKIWEQLKKPRFKRAQFLLMGIIVLGIALHNFLIFFYTPVNDQFYSFQATKLLELANVINVYKPRIVFLPAALIVNPQMTIYSNGTLVQNQSNPNTMENALITHEPIIDLFTTVKYQQVGFDPTSVDDIISSTQIADLVIIDFNNDPSLGKALLSRIDSNPEQVPNELLRGANNKVEYVLLGRALIGAF